MAGKEKMPWVGFEREFTVKLKKTGAPIITGSNPGNGSLPFYRDLGPLNP